MFLREFIGLVWRETRPAATATRRRLMRGRRVVRRAAQGLAQFGELTNQTEPVEGFRTFRGPPKHLAQPQRRGYLHAAEHPLVDGPLDANLGSDVCPLQVFLPVGAVDGRVELEERAQSHRRRVA